MSGTDKDYGREFDHYVQEHTGWLDSLSDPKTRRKRAVKAFLRGFGSILNFFPSSKETYLEHHPIYANTSLNSVQKDAVLSGTTWQKVTESLDSIILGTSTKPEISITEAKESKKLAQEMYDQYKMMYVYQASK